MNEECKAFFTMKYLFRCFSRYALSSFEYVCVEKEKSIMDSSRKVPMQVLVFVLAPELCYMALVLVSAAILGFY